MNSFGSFFFLLTNNSIKLNPKSLKMLPQPESFNCKVCQASIWGQAFIDYVAPPHNNGTDVNRKSVKLPTFKVGPNPLEAVYLPNCKAHEPSLKGKALVFSVLFFLLPKRVNDT